MQIIQYNTSITSHELLHVLRVHFSSSRDGGVDQCRALVKAIDIEGVEVRGRGFVRDVPVTALYRDGRERGYLRFVYLVSDTDP